MLISLILPWLFKLCAGFLDIFMIGLWLQPNPVSSVDSWHLVNTQTHAHTHFPTVALTSLFPPAVLYTPASPLSYALCSRPLPVSRFLLCFFLLLFSHNLPGSPQFSIFGPPNLRCDQWSLNKCWDWTSVGQHQPPACLLRCNHTACVCCRGLHIKTYISDKTSSWCLVPPSLFLGILTQKTQVLFTLLKKGC